MVDPIATSFLIQGYTGQRQRSQRHAVELKGSIEGVGIDQTVHIQDISNTGMATVGEAPLMCNDQFLNIHIEGYKRMHGHIVRQFEGGHALKFEENAKHVITDEELTAFLRIAKITS